MTDQQRPTYSVVITLTLPGDGGQTALHLTLGPADELPAVDGSRRLLQDCTLADLQQFADRLEAELWADYLDATLVDLAVDQDLHVDFAFLDNQDQPAPTGQLLLDHAVLFPHAEARQDPEPLDEPDPATDDVPVAAGQAQEEDEVSDGPESGDQAEAEPAAGEEVAASPPEAEPLPDRPESAAAETAAEDQEPQVTVAEAEQVHEEREAVVEPGAEAIRPRVRILGRRRPLGHSTPSAVDILINEPAFRDAQAHALSSPEREVAGVLIGPQPEKQPDGRYVVHITDMIIARHTRMQGASVTYTPESWRYVNDRLAQMYPDEAALIVGWYHTHPGFGIFLSGMDRFIHHNFFTQIWHVALVLDPRARRSGFFSWDRAKTRVDAYDFPWPNWAAESW